MLKEASSLLSGLLPVGEVVTEEEATEEVTMRRSGY